MSKLLNLNEYGGQTFVIDLSKVYKIVIDEDTKGNYIVKNYRRGFFVDKLLYSFTDNSDWSSMVESALEKLRIHTNTKEKVVFIDGYWKKEINFYRNHQLKI